MTTAIQQAREFLDGDQPQCPRALIMALLEHIDSCVLMRAPLQVSSETRRLAVEAAIRAMFEAMHASEPLRDGPIDFEAEIADPQNAQALDEMRSVAGAMVDAALATLGARVVP